MTVLFKKISLLALLCSMSVSFYTGCGNGNKTSEPDTSYNEPVSDNKEGVSITDSMGNSVTLNADSTVVSLYASYSECWLLAGGTLAGVTKDAFEERELGLSKDIKVVGSVKEPDLEAIIMLDPDYVIMSADLTAHTDIENNLKDAGISYGYYRVDTFSDYDYIMTQFCKVTGRDDLYHKNVIETSERIASIKDTVQNAGMKSPTVLLMRAFSTGVKAKGDDNTAGMILKDLGCFNLVDNNPSLLEDLSVEEIIMSDPDYIFVTTMGDENEALAYLEDNMISNPAWSGLKAIENDCYHVLPKDLFHYKPNNRWDESYEYLAKILFPECFQ